MTGSRPSLVSQNAVAHGAPNLFVRFFFAGYFALSNFFGTTPSLTRTSENHLISARQSLGVLCQHIFGAVRI